MNDSDLRKMVKECLENDTSALTEWEIEFLDSVFKRDTYTPKQAAIIERIWNKIFG